MSTESDGRQWRLRRSSGLLRLERLRAFGSAELTWADLFSAELTDAELFVLYFPSRFELPIDEAATETLKVFAANTSSRTSVNFWDPRDRNFETAIGLFGIRTPPALVLATGLHAADPDVPSLYSISFEDPAVLTDRERTAAAVNLAHGILTRCDRREIASYVRARKAKGLLSLLGRGAGTVRDELVRLNPKFGLPGGLSLELGGGDP
jgi:hypothetical protein